MPIVLTTRRRAAYPADCMRATRTAGSSFEGTFTELASGVDRL